MAGLPIRRSPIPATALRRITASWKKTAWRPTSNTAAFTWNSGRDSIRTRSRQKTSTAMKSMTSASVPWDKRCGGQGTKRVKTASGYVSGNARYRAVRCEGCPLRCRYSNAKGNRMIELNHRLRRYRQKAKGLLCSGEGLKHRGQRCIEPEDVFGQMKNNMNYKRFRHFGKDKVFMDFSFFAIAFNIKKRCVQRWKKNVLAG